MTRRYRPRRLRPGRPPAAPQWAIVATHPVTREQAEAVAASVREAP